MQHSFYAANDSLHFLLKFEDVQGVMDVLQSATAMEYAVTSGPTLKDQVLLGDSLVKSSRKITDIEGQLYMRISLPQRVVKEPNTLHVRLWQALVGQERMASRYHIPLKAEMMQKDYLVMQVGTAKPLFHSYINTSDRLLVRHYGREPDSMQVQYYEAEFMPALPPMSSRQEPVPQQGTSVADTLVFAPEDTIRLEKPGLYLFAPESRFAKGILVQKWAYPQVTMAEELLHPLIYLTTSTEREALFRAPDTKEAVDGFWLKVAGDKATARELIRDYYGRVETANRLFTSHKPGWSTDRGMIYVIFGRPSNISYSGNSETWIYRESEVSPYVKFVFNKKENNFTENHYELVRHRDYEDSWYSTVAKWRAGITEM